MPPPLRVVIYRRLMMRIAERIAEAVRAQALVTGDVVGQVASQTLENMTAIDDAGRMPVLRPLVGMDKEEITAEAQRWARIRCRSCPIRTAARCSRPASGDGTDARSGESSSTLRRWRSRR